VPAHGHKDVEGMAKQEARAESCAGFFSFALYGLPWKRKSPFSDLSGLGSSVILSRFGGYLIGFH
jgi:hypothetical protein